MDNIEDYQIISFISVGGESIVFMGVKESVGRTYAMKFRSTEYWNEFYDYERKTFHALEQCSASKIAGMIQMIPHAMQKELFRMVPKAYQKNENCKKLILPYFQFFCIIEDYIPGWNMKDYCEGAPDKNIEPHTPGENASYEEVVEFQKKLLNWTKQFCEIMMRITNEKHYLHLDIKGDNIMIQPETESLVIVDLGKALEISSMQKPISLKEEFHVQEVGIYGTPGYASPECCDEIDAKRALKYNNTGSAGIQSDIFSFGATLWECINANSGIRICMAEDGYFRRDLFHTPEGYIPEMEEIIVKCTEKDPQKRYQTYEELKAAAIHAEKQLALRDKPSRALLAVSIMTGIVALLLAITLLINIRAQGLTFEIAKNNLDELAVSYTEHDLTEYKEAAAALIQADETRESSYFDILNISYQSNDEDTISREEFEEVLLSTISHTENPELKKQYIDTIMQHVKEQDIRSIVETIVVKQTGALNGGQDCIGYEIAEAISNYMTSSVDSYQRLITYKDMPEYKTTLMYLARILENDSSLISQIAESTDQPQEKVKEQLEDIRIRGEMRG